MMANGSFSNLGWATMLPLGLLHRTNFKLFDDRIFFGLYVNRSYDQNYIFTKENCPAEKLQYISSQYFTIERETMENCANLRPAVLTVCGKNGLLVNDQHFPTNHKTILKNQDIVFITTGLPLFQYQDDRVYDTEGFPTRLLNDYHIDSHIGKGGQSSIRLVHNRNTGGKFVMKIIPKKRYCSESKESYEKRQQHMMDEVKIMKALKHPNIIQFVEKDFNRNYLYIIMDYAAQGDLLAYIKTFRGGCLPESDAKLCLYQVCKGLEYIHSMNIAHRDIKVENIFTKIIRRNCQSAVVYLIGDFGYSKEVENHLITQLGTFRYCPPEVLNSNGQEYTIKTDIWTLGCLFFAVLSGRFPFDESYGGSVEEQICEGRLNFNTIQWDYVSLIL